MNAPTSARGVFPSHAPRAAAVAIALALILTGCSGGESGGPTETSGSPAAPTSAAAAPTASSADVEANPSPSPSSGAALPDIPLRDASVPAPPETLGTPPTQITLAALDLSMPVLPVGVAADGQTEVLADANEAGWYRFGPGSGAEAGATVILAHAGSLITPRGPFSRLKNLEGGEEVKVSDAVGNLSAYRVVSIEILEKAALDLTPYFVRDGDPRLILITCGGQWDEEAGSYLSNVVVTAVPI